MSLIPACQRLEKGDYSYSVTHRLNNPEMNSFSRVSQPTSIINTLRNSEFKGKKEELKSRHIESTNSEVIVSGVTIASSDSDVTIRERGINKRIAKKRYAQKRSLVLSKGSFKSLLRLYSQTFVLIALILSMIISVVGGLFNVKLHEHKSTVSTSSEPLSCYGFCSLSSLFILREFLATIIIINGGLCFCNNKEMILNDNETVSRSPCMRPRSDTLSFGPIERGEKQTNNID